MANKRVSLKGKGADLFFGDYTADSVEAAPETPDATNEPTILLDNAMQPPSATASPALPEPAAEPTPHATARASPARSPARQRSHQRASAPASTLASVTADDGFEAVIEAIRKTVKVPGKEVSFTRLTPTEKGRLADIVYTYKRQGVKTSENEINRIAVNYMLADFEAHGERSILARVIAALLA